MNIVKQLRKQALLTQQAFAALVGTSQSTVAAYETGSKSPTLRTLERCASCLGLELDVRFIQGLTREERRSLAYHHAVAQRLLASPEEVVARAQRNLNRLRSMHPYALDLLNQWAALLQLPPGLLTCCLTDTSEVARDLRQVSPFAGVLTTAERHRALARFRKDDAA